MIGAAKSGTAIGLAQLSYAFVGFFVSLGTAAAFGAAATTDAYFMATSTGELLAKILLGGALTSVFLPFFVEHLTHNDAPRAWRLFSSLFTLALGAFLVLGTLLELLAPLLVRVLAPGFDPGTQALTVLLLRIVFPAYLFSFLTDLATVPLHAHRRFGLPAVSRLVVPTLSLFLLLSLAAQIGIRTLAFGMLGGSLLQLMLLLVSLRRSGYSVQLDRPWSNPDVARTLRLTLPFIFSILAAHGAGAVYRILVSLEPPGSLASLKFAEKIFQMANVLFVSTITQIAFPAFARAVASGTVEEVRARVRSASRVVLFFALPLTVGVVLLRIPLVRMLYERGAFTAEATATTALLVPLYMIGLLGNGWSSLLGHLTLALKDTRRAVGVNIALQALASALFVVLVPRMGVPGLALVSGIGPFLLTALYLFALRDRVPGLLGALADRQTGALLAAGIACVGGVLLGQRLGFLFYPGPAQDLVTLVASGSLGAACYLTTAHILRVPEIQTLRTLAGHLGVNRLRRLLG